MGFSGGGGGSTPVTAPLKLVATAGNPAIQVYLANGDAQPAFEIFGDGQQQWGPGGAGALDTNLRRSGAAALLSDSSTLTMGASLLTNGSLDAKQVGGGVKVAEGANAKQGTGTLVAGTVTIANTNITANSRIFITPQNLAGAAVPQALSVTARVVGTSFTVTSASALDTSTFAYEIFEPG